MVSSLYACWARLLTCIINVSRIIKLEMVKINDYRLECPPTDRRVEDQNEVSGCCLLTSASFKPKSCYMVRIVMYARLGATENVSK